VTSASDLFARWPLVGRSEEQRQLHAALLADNRRGVVIAGQPGVGKSRLADELHALADSAGFTTCRLAATPSGRDIPLGVFFGLLPGPDAGADVRVVSDLVDRIRRLGSDGRLLLVVDDVHDVDQTSAMVLYQVAVQDLAFVLVTQRSGTSVPDPLTALWKDDRAVRIDLDPLTPPQTEQLAIAALGGHIEGSTARALWEVTRGNPLYLREVLLGAHHARLLEATGGVWHLDGFPHSPRLTELVEARLADLADDQRDLLEHLALAEPLPLDLVDALADRAAVDQLDRHGLLTITQVGDRTDLYVAHPLHGEVLRSSISELRALAINRRLADLAEHVTGIDPIRSAVWRLDGGGEVGANLMITAARHAHFARDDALAERLARAAWDTGGGVDAGMVLGEALLALGRPVEADRVLAGLAGVVRDERDLAIVAMNRAETLQYGLGRLDDADAVLASAQAALGAGHWCDEVRGARAGNRLLAGHPLDAVASAEPLLSHADRRVRVEASNVVAPALAVAGRTLEAIGVAQRAYEDALALGDQLALDGPGLHLVGQALAETEAGRVVAAVATARHAYDEAIDRQTTTGQAWAAMARSRVALTAGCFDEAERFGAEGALLFRGLGQLGQARWCLTARAWALASRGHHDRAGEVMAELDALGADHLRMMDVDVERCRAWVVVGDRQLTIARLQSAGEAGRNTGTLALASGAFHDLVRLECVELALDPLTELATEVDGELMAARLAHARALADRAPEDLEVVAAEFERLGTIPFAAEAWAQVSALWRSEGRARRARRAGQTAQALAHRCAGLATPAMALAGEAAALTTREREVVGCAARGRSNRDIASELGLSVRTVENHLQHAFEKLGTSRREELAALLDATAPPE
jgi:ATP/maltotriose-dependent transcriptional regulator MalT